MTWEGLTPPYRCIVADPPWPYTSALVGTGGRGSEAITRGSSVGAADRYSLMPIEDLKRLPVLEAADKNAHLYLWTTSRYLRDAFDVVRAWGWRFSQTLTWCKPPWGIGAGGAFCSTTEFVLFCRKGNPKPLERQNTTWWEWERQRPHSTKPQAFLDVVERVSPGPYVELFSRNPRMGWDSWGLGHEGVA